VELDINSIPMLIMAGILLFFLLIGTIKWEIPVIETTVVKITDPQTKYLPHNQKKKKPPITMM
jgi:hypothetical protein